MRLREIRRRAAEHLVLLLQQTNPLTQLTGLVSLGPGHARLRAGLDGGLADPVLQAGLADPEVRCDLTQRDPELVVVAVKAGAIEAVVEQIAPAVGAETIIIPFLNGMRHMDLLHARYPGHVIGGLIKIVAALDDQGGAVQMTSLAEVTIGSLPAGPPPSWVKHALDVAGLTVIEAAEVEQDLWEKWAFISAAGIVTCLFDNTVGNIREAGGLPYLESAIAESERVATAAGHEPREASQAQSRGILTEPGSAFTSSLFRDLSAGKTTEAEHILGDFAQRARVLGVSTPLLDLALVRIRAAEAARSAVAR